MKFSNSFEKLWQQILLKLTEKNESHSLKGLVYFIRKLPDYIAAHYTRIQNSIQKVGKKHCRDVKKCIYNIMNGIAVANEFS